MKDIGKNECPNFRQERGGNLREKYREGERERENMFTGTVVQTGCSKRTNSGVDQKVIGGMASPFRPRIDKQTVLAHSRKTLVLFSCTDLNTLEQLSKKKIRGGN